jgi:hypothetical protein
VPACGVEAEAGPMLDGESGVHRLVLAMGTTLFIGALLGLGTLNKDRKIGPIAQTIGHLLLPPITAPSSMSRP